MADVLVWVSVATLYGTLGVAAYLPLGGDGAKTLSNLRLLQRSYLRLQWCMVTLSCCVTLRYALLGTRLAIAWVTNVTEPGSGVMGGGAEEWLKQRYIYMR